MVKQNRNAVGNFTMDMNFIQGNIVQIYTCKYTVRIFQVSTLSRLEFELNKKLY
jgi:hypothetical protein